MAGGHQERLGDEELQEEEGEVAVRHQVHQVDEELQEGGAEVVVLQQHHREEEVVVVEGVPHLVREGVGVGGGVPLLRLEDGEEQVGLGEEVVPLGRAVAAEGVEAHRKWAVDSVQVAAHWDQGGEVELQMPEVEEVRQWCQSAIAAGWAVMASGAAELEARLIQEKENRHRRTWKCQASEAEVEAQKARNHDHHSLQRQNRMTWKVGGGVAGERLLRLPTDSDSVPYSQMVDERMTGSRCRALRERSRCFRERSAKAFLSMIRGWAREMTQSIQLYASWRRQ